MHFRTGYGRAGFLSNIWAIAVDLFSLTLLVWVGTGLYLWWKLSSTRRWGWAAIGAGAASFLILLLTL